MYMYTYITLQGLQDLQDLQNRNYRDLMRHCISPNVLQEKESTFLPACGAGKGK